MQLVYLYQANQIGWRYMTGEKMKCCNHTVIKTYCFCHNCSGNQCDEPIWTVRDCGCPEEHPEGHQEGCGVIKNPAH
jgi:hypothetical protein